MIRDVVFLVSVFGMLPITFTAPHAGVLLWGWFSFMQPHREAWNVAGALRINLIIAAVTIFTWLISREPKRLPIDATTLLLLLFGAWITITTLDAVNPELAWYYWGRTIKTLLFIVMIIIIMQSRVRIHAFMWILAVSLGYWSIKGGLFFILSGGKYRFFGPEQSVIYDNNHLALALVMILPVLNYLRLQSADKYVRLGLVGVMLATVVSVLISYSRGGLVGLAAGLGLLWFRSKGKLLTLMFLIPLLATFIAFAPQNWKDRAGTLENITQDPSFVSRSEAWRVNFGYAVDHPITGAGFAGTWSGAIFARYSPGSTGRRAAHSIYFQVLGEHGFVGFAIYVAIMIVAWRNASWISRAARNRPDLAWAGNLASMLKVSLFSFFIAGAALSMAYYDAYLALIAILAITRRQVALALTDEARQPEVSGVPVRSWSA